MSGDVNWVSLVMLTGKQLGLPVWLEMKYRFVISEREICSKGFISTSDETCLKIREFQGFVCLLYSLFMQHL